MLLITHSMNLTVVPNDFTYNSFSLYEAPIVNFKLISKSNTYVFLYLGSNCPCVKYRIKLVFPTPPLPTTITFNETFDYA